MNVYRTRIVTVVLTLTLYEVLIATLDNSFGGMFKDLGESNFLIT